MPVPSIFVDDASSMLSTKRLNMLPKWHPTPSACPVVHRVFFYWVTTCAW